MTDSTEENVLMICRKCRYEEDVPVWVLEELCDKTKDGYVMACPNCGKKMIQKDIRNVLAK